MRIAHWMIFYRANMQMRWLKFRNRLIKKQKHGIRIRIHRWTGMKEGKKSLCRTAKRKPSQILKMKIFLPCGNEKKFPIMETCGIIPQRMCSIFTSTETGRKWMFRMRFLIKSTEKHRFSWQSRYRRMMLVILGLPVRKSESAWQNESPANIRQAIGWKRMRIQTILRWTLFWMEAIKIRLRKFARRLMEKRKPGGRKVIRQLHGLQQPKKQSTKEIYGIIPKHRNLISITVQDGKRWLQHRLKLSLIWLMEKLKSLSVHQFLHTQLEICGLTTKLQIS